MSLKAKAMFRRLLPIISTALAFSSPFCLAYAQTAPSPKTHQVADPKHCLAFWWDNDITKSAIMFPVTLNDKTLRFQLDTGHAQTILYDNVKDAQKWVDKTHSSFTSKNLTFGPEHLQAFPITFYRNVEGTTEPQNEAQGSIGLNALAGKIVLINYPTQEICLYASPNDLPASSALKSMLPAHYTPDGLLALTARIEDINLPSIVYDTGADIFNIVVPFKIWSQLTHLAAAEQAPFIFNKWQFWSSLPPFYGEPQPTHLTIGPYSFTDKVIYTSPDNPIFENQAHVGNKVFLNKTVILDLRKHPAWGIL